MSCLRFTASISKPARTSSRRIRFGSTPDRPRGIRVGRTRPRNQPARRGTRAAGGRRILDRVQSRALWPARWVPTTKAISVTGGVTFEQLRKNFYEQARGLVEGGADLLLLETCQDTRNIKAGVLAVQDLSREIGAADSADDFARPSKPMGTMLAGPEHRSALWSSLDHLDLLSLGLNCATGPEFMTDHSARCNRSPARVRLVLSERRSAERRRPLRETPTSLAEQLERFVASRLAEHRRRMLRHHRTAHSRDRADGRGKSAAPSRRSKAHRAVYSGIEIIEAEESTRPLIVGERTNVIGSRQFKNLVAAEQWEEATEIARRQVKSGAHIVDVCLQSTDRDEIKDIPPFLRSAHPQNQSADHDRHHGRARHRARRSPIARARASSTRSTSKTAKKNSSAFARWHAPMAPRSLSAASTKIPCRRRRSRASANSKSPSAPTSCSPKNTASAPKTSFSIRSCFRAPRAMKTISAAPWKRSKASG